MDIFAAFTWDFSLGNVFTILGGIITVTATFAAQSAEIRSLKSMAEGLKTRIDQVERTGGTVAEQDRQASHETLRDHEERLRRLEGSIGKLDSKIDLVSRDVSYIRDAIKAALSQGRLKE